MKNNIVIDGVEYVRAESQPKDAEGRPFVVVRTYSAGVHFGYLDWQNPENPKHLRLANSRRVHFWKGAASLSQMAVDGINNASESRVSMTVSSIELTEAIEIISTTSEAKSNLEGQPVWKI